MRAVEKGILNEGGWLDGCDCGGVEFWTEGGRVRQVWGEYKGEEEGDKEEKRKKEER